MRSNNEAHWYTRTLLRTVFALVLVVLLVGCGGGGTSASTTQSPVTSSPGATATGVFLDSAVQGLAYVSGTITGVTTANGTFKYQVGKPIQFSIGGIVLGKTSGKAIITPIDLVSGGDGTDPTVVNIARFLQTIDNDGNPSNGIQIPAEIRTLAQGKSIKFSESETAFTNDGNVQILVSELTAATTAGARSLVSSNVAQVHLSSTISTYFGPSGSSSGAPSSSNTLTVTGSGASRSVSGTYAVDVSKTSASEGNGILAISWIGTSSPLWSIDISVPAKGGSGASSIYFKAMFSSIFDCSNNSYFGVSGDCSPVTYNATARTVTLNNAELIDTYGSDVIHISGTLKY